MWESCKRRKSLVARPAAAEALFSRVFGESVASDAVGRYARGLGGL
jgi:hypothetical protein